MRDKRKIKRDAYIWSGQRKIVIKRRVISCTLLLGVAVLGWFLFNPTYNLLSKYVSDNKDEVVESEVSSSRPIVESKSEVVLSETTASETDKTEQVLPLSDKSVYIAHNILLDENLLRNTVIKLKKEGASQIVFDLKNSDGSIMYQSELEIVKTSLSQNEAPYNLANCVNIIKNEGLIPVGRIFAFKDRVASASMQSAAVKYMNSEINWLDNSRDNGGKPWLNPASVEARDYIMQIFDEVMPYFDIILFDGIEFPTGYSLDKATYGIQNIDKSAVLDTFMDTVINKGEENNVTVIPVISAKGMFEPNGEMYGLDVSRLLLDRKNIVFDVRPAIFGRGLVTENISLPQPSQQPYETLMVLLKELETIPCENKIYTLQEHSSLVDGQEVKFDVAKIDEQKKAFEENKCENIFYCS